MIKQVDKDFFKLNNVNSVYLAEMLIKNLMLDTTKVANVDYLVDLTSRIEQNREEFVQYFQSIGTIGQKFSKNKLDMGKLFIQFPNACQGIVLASHFGHEKYKKTDCPKTWSNFKNVDDAEYQYKSAGIRHEFETEESEESGLPPIFHQLWNKVAEFEMWVTNNNINIKELAEKKLPIWREQFGN